MKRWISGFVLLTLLLLCLGAAQADPDFGLQDASKRTGSWAEVYAGILNERSAGIKAYQDHVLSITSLPSCHPVGLQDLTGDGIPELLFIDLVDDTEYGFQVGRFWVYTCSGESVHCTLTLQPEIDDLLYSRYYLGKDGLLTLYFSDCEMSWAVQLRLDPGGHYAVENILIEQPDFSGESPDEYLLNGKKINAKKYKTQSKKFKSAQGHMIGSLMVDDNGTGFTYTLEEALDALAGKAE